MVDREGNEAVKIGVVGGMNFDNVVLDTFLWNLKEKYPDATIVTGQGKGAEKHAAESASALGFKIIVLEVTTQETIWFGAEALLLQVEGIVFDADVTLCVGSGGRVKLAWEIHHRLDMTQRDARGHIPKKNPKSGRSPGSERRIHHIAIPKAKPKATPTKQAKKKPEMLAA